MAPSLRKAFLCPRGNCQCHDPPPSDPNRPPGGADTHPGRGLLQGLLRGQRCGDRERLEPGQGPPAPSLPCWGPAAGGSAVGGDPGSVRRPGRGRGAGCPGSARESRPGAPAPSRRLRTPGQGPFSAEATAARGPLLLTSGLSTRARPCEASRGARPSPSSGQGPCMRGAEARRGPRPGGRRPPASPHPGPAPTGPSGVCTPRPGTSRSARGRAAPPGKCSSCRPQAGQPVP